MARVPPELTVVFSASSVRDLEQIWEWNASTRGEWHANKYIHFLRHETGRLAERESPGREVPTNSSLRYHTLKLRPKGHGHVIIFFIEGKFLHVLRYFHTSQDWENIVVKDNESADND